MPHKNTIRQYASGLHYHVYNRGVDKRIIYKTDQDYQQFLSIIEYYLLPSQEKETITRRSELDENEVELLCYCLMPNHFHLLLKQNTSNGITRFMRRLSNTYVQYFNKIHDRIGTLFQGKFKAALIDTNEYLLHLSRYIHTNPLELQIKNLKDYPFSSYQEYLNIRKTLWINTKTILGFYLDPENSLSKTPPTYQDFVEISQPTKYKKEMNYLTLD